jgi:hypothetical protein
MTERYDFGDLYDFGEFLRSLKDMGYQEIIQEAERQVRDIEAGLSGVRGVPRQRRLVAGRYAHRLKEFLFFMRSGTRPGGADDVTFQMYRPICERLVERGECKPSVLELFARRDPGS